MKFAVILSLVLVSQAAFAQQKGWEKEWNDALEGGKKESRVVVATSADPVMREIAARFKARFGITVEHLAGSSTQLAARLATERQAGIHSVDVFLGGVQTVANVLYGERMLDPLRPALIHTDVVDGKKWKRGKLWFADPEERYVLRVFSTITSLLHINADHVKAGELTKAVDLLAPKWRGKIATEDITVAGSGSNTAARVYLQTNEDFARRLYVGQNMRSTRDRRQLTDWLARGTYPIVFGAQSSDVDRMVKEGFPLKEVLGFGDMPPALTGSPWMPALMQKAPHPAAAKVFLNWILSKEALEIYARAEGRATLRSDMDESFIPAEEMPKPGVNYFDTYDWQFTVS
ncbi:MAG: extracellular solute-binding protein, partial [Deltaproteobacteria bacterium]|nr:extracellular solute-binding protein [Deltaproteobacteria bacterium]